VATEGQTIPATQPAMLATLPTLSAEGLCKSFTVREPVLSFRRARDASRLTALDGLHLQLAAGEILGVAGESGSGKSTLAKCLVGLLRPDAGKVRFRGVDVGAARGRELEALRRGVQLIYQNPYSSLNPLLSAGEAIAEPAWVHGLIERRERHAFARETLGLVGLGAEIAARRPGELSGGQRQRVAIARAMALQPDLLIADEAVSGLDVEAQTRILDLLAALRDDRGLGVLLISHQLSVLARLADRVLIMYLGRVVESGPTAGVLSTPGHPYTAGLLAAAPGAHRRSQRRAPALHGEAPSPLAIPSGCRFRTRCPRAEAICAAVDPPRVEVGPGQDAWCHFAGHFAGVPHAGRATGARSADTGRTTGAQSAVG
jgi:oligopeptide transport system ATP-binding protein